jgi:DNA-directed RNA polymerase subunit RPC12/RpoP
MGHGVETEETMPTYKCAICGKEMKVSEAQYKLMSRMTIMTCSHECALKAIERD